MIKYFLIIFLCFFINEAYAQEEISIVLEKAQINFHDKKSLERGAKYFATVCMACHTLIYMRNDTLAQKAGITYEKMPTKITNWPNGVKPPDLSLEVSRRGADWIYTYLHSFYTDTTRPTGFNNLLVPKTAMPDMVAAFQGRQILVPRENKIYDRDYQWYDLVQLQAHGSMTPEQYDVMDNDNENFLAYASEPYKVEQERLGLWVIVYFLILFILMVALKHAYWKDLQRPRHK
ncbi:MAG: cytochrome c1 [Gammaproteobacteria bacterium]